MSMKGFDDKHGNKQAGDDSSGDTSSHDSSSESEWEQEEIERLITSSGPEHSSVSASPSSDSKSFFLLVVLFSWAAKFNVSNTALSCLLTIIHHILTQCFSIIGSTARTFFPSSLYLARRKLGFMTDTFDKFITCPKCTSLYTWSHFTNASGMITSKTCRNQMYANSHNPKACGARLLKQVKSKDDASFIPLKTYPYASIINSIEHILKRNNNWDFCQAWKERVVPTHCYADIYDGSVWQSFGKHLENGKWFFSGPNLGLMMNIDWFQPFKRRSDISVGAVYLVLLNLPRTLRYRKENCIVVGIIPNLEKEPSDLRHLLRPVVNELQVLWKGVKMQTSHHKHGIYLRGALVSVACDIPAARKTSGFIGHSAKQGCSKCTKAFPGSVGNMNYGGFDTYLWGHRSVSAHRKYATMVENSSTKTEAKRLASAHGYRYTPLLDLPYFDSVRHTVIDPMHNLFTGTAKHMWRQWNNLCLFTPKDMDTINNRLVEMSAASDCGWVPKNISANWGAWTAHEWKAWILVYSLYALQGVLEKTHLKVWQTFVLACQKIVKPFVTLTETQLAENLFIKFGKECEKLYGSGFITPNIHLHVHLPTCIQEFGSIYSFWLFAFERFNFNLGVLNTNGKDLEIQMMKQVMEQRELVQMQQPFSDQIKATFGDILSIDQQDQGVPNHNKCIHVPTSSQNGCVTSWKELDHIAFPQEFKVLCLQRDDQQLLKQCYQAMYPNITITDSMIAISIKRYKCVYSGKEIFGSLKYGKSKKYGFICASWAANNGEIDFEGEERPGHVSFYFTHTPFASHSISDGFNGKIHVFAAVRWFMPYPDNCPYLPPISQWLDNKYVSPGPASFIPIQRIYSKVAVANVIGNRLIVASMPPKVYI